MAKSKATTFSSRSNAKRAAEKAIRDGSAPSIDYGIKPSADDRYRFEVVWLTKGGTEEAPTTEEVSTEIATANTDPETGMSVDNEDAADDHEEESETAVVPEALAGTPANSSDGEQSMPDLFPPGTRVIVQVGKRKRSAGIVDYRVDATSCRVKFDGPHPSVLCRYNQLSLDDGSEPLPSTVKTERKARAAPSGDHKPSKNAELDAAAARGEMPAKPIMTSKANKEQYQKRFDLLEKASLAGNWDAVRAYEVKGINSYAKMVAAYRDRLLAAHAASVAADEAA
jgi:hypothetical protein